MKLHGLLGDFMKLCRGTQEIYRPCRGILQDDREMIGLPCLLGTIGEAELIRLYVEDMTVNYGKIPMFMYLLGNVYWLRMNW